ncbi:MAG: hypothetical protein EOO71_28940 [Myxococcaceae bacterium]|nr:MAG: hypothetical protein EOO71_28940 [Myxococcaceae bacterium]
MPYWLGMLTGDEHPHLDVVHLVQQISFELYFREQPVCAPPDFVHDPGIDLSGITAANPVRLLLPCAKRSPSTGAPRDRGDLAAFETVLQIRKDRNQSWSNLEKAARALLRLSYESFGTRNVEANANSVVRTIARESGLTIAELADIFTRQRNA